jgi:uncharacterized protein (DUF1800 family)
MQIRSRFYLVAGLAFLSVALARAATTPVPTITAAGTQAHIPLGQFYATVTGTNFTASSTVQLCGTVVPSGYNNSTSLTIAGICSHAGATTLIVSNGSVSSKPFTVKIGIDNPKASPAAARRFLEQAAFGPTPSDALSVQTLGMSAWIDAQFALPQSSTYKSIAANAYNMMQAHFMTDAVTAPDQLRQRVAFALSQIFVTSEVTLSNAEMVPYQDMLLADSFTNYKQIMGDVTLSTAMGKYLNMANNAKADPTVGSLPNENYAREIMQLFTIGVSQLNTNGTVKIGSDGLPVPTYTQANVEDFARVYTGWTYKGAPGAAPKWPGNLANYGPMVSYPAQHDTGAKTLLNGFVSPAGLTPEADLANALNNIFNHANVGPFVSRLLIQHLVKSNPSSAYIGRVAAVFNKNSAGVRGDMKSVIKAILLDPEARANDEGGNDQATDGHLQEPALFIAGMYRAFGGYIQDTSNYAWYLTTLGQPLYTSPDVFNYYDAGNMLPGTSTSAPEFDIFTPSSAVLRSNQVQGLFGAQTNVVQHAGTGTQVDLSYYIYLGSYPAQLVDALDLALTHGTMPAEMKQIIITAVTNEKTSNLRRVQKGAFLILSSNYYNVWH